MNKEELKAEIYKIVEKYQRDKNHAKQVKLFSLMMFDQTEGIIHDLSSRQRTLLKVGAILHDIGYYLGAEKHNRSSYKLILENKIHDFDNDEMLTIANIARHHRGKLPDKDHECYAGFSKSKYRKQALKLAAFTRLADALDSRAVELKIKEIHCEYDKISQILYINAVPESKEYKPNMESIIRKKDLFEKMYQVQVVVTFQ